MTWDKIRHYIFGGLAIYFGWNMMWESFNLPNPPVLRMMFIFLSGCGILWGLLTLEAGIKKKEVNVHE